MTTSIAFAVPGDIETLTGGYLYDFNLMKALSASGLTVRHMAWGASFPQPTAQDACDALAQLQSLPRDLPAVVDGLAFGALETEGLQRVSAPLYALVHHPLALEPGLDPALARNMAEREKANLEIARHIFVTSPHTGGILRAHYGVAPDKITIILPGFDAQARTDTLKDDPPLILSVGILAQRKGHDVLLRALAQIKDLAWQADIVGRDHETGMTARLSALIEELGLTGRARLSGEISQEALVARYRRASLFALATRYEGYGIVFGEAMGHGLPIVSTRAGAVPETVAPQAGLLVEADDVDAFAAALRRMLTDTALRNACADASLRAGEALSGWPEAARVLRSQLG
jgi:glycosyltransferase involved in cell wall biosynthesis